MDDKTFRKLMKNIKYTIIKIDKYPFPVELMVLGVEEDSKIPLILGRIFMKTSRILMDIDKYHVKVRIKYHVVCFYMINIT